MIEFDTWTNEYPVTMTVTWYRDSTQLEQQTYDVTSAMFFCDTPVSVYNKIVISIPNMIRPNRYLKIFNIYDGTTRNFYNEEIENLTIIEQIDSNNTSLAINQGASTLLPQSTTGVQFQRTLPFMIYRNEVLYGKFFINSATANTNKTLYNIKVNDWTSILEGQRYLGGTFSNTSVSAILAVLMGDVPYTLDAEIGAKTITGYLPILNKREALRQIAFATNALVDTSRSDKVEIKAMPTTVTTTLGEADIVSIQATQQPIVTKYVIDVQNLAPVNTTADVLFEGTINGSTTILFDSPSYDLAITGGTITASNINYATITGNGAVVLTGKVYEIADTQYEKANNYAVASDIEKQQRFNTTIVTNITDMLNGLHFVDSKIKSKHRMGDVRVGEMVNLYGTVCRVTKLSYDVTQAEIYCSAEMEAYYE